VHDGGRGPGSGRQHGGPCRHLNCTAATECTGTRHGDIINGSSGADEMSGRAGDDLMKGNGGSDEMEGGLGADKVLGGPSADKSVCGGEQIGASSSFTYPEKSGDIASGGPGGDFAYGGFGQGGVDLVYGNGANDTIIVAQRGFPSSIGKVKVTKEVVDCGTGEDMVYRDRRLDVIADDCEHKRSGYPDMIAAAPERSRVMGGLFAATTSGP
jgi:Ca2+-binding RTX toxin-like protein